MSLSYQNVYLGSNEEGEDLKGWIRRVAESNSQSVSDFCRDAILLKLKQLDKRGALHGPPAKSKV